MLWFPVLPPHAVKFLGRNNGEQGQLGQLLLPDTSCLETGYIHLKRVRPPLHTGNLPLWLHVDWIFYHLI